VQEAAAAEHREDGQEEEALPEDGRFLPATAFTGSKDGYYFTTGTQGTGYYSVQGPESAAEKSSSGAEKPAANGDSAAGTAHHVVEYGVTGC
jgi:hypothetical protein